MPITLADVQSTPSPVNVRINRVGINNFKLPISIVQKKGSYQHTVADISVYVDLPAHIKGTNMSRLVVGVHNFQNEPINHEMLLEIAEHIRIKAEADVCQLIYKFPYFMNKLSPIAKEKGILHYNVEFNGTVNSKEPDKNNFNLSVEVIATTLCPCSKEISTANAHNQKCYIKISVDCNGWVWIEDLINIAENSSSCEIYSILKRIDEKYVTERMYDNPRFVEDVAREVYKRLENFENISKFSVDVIADESIHQHRAYARLET